MEKSTRDGLMAAGLFITGQARGRRCSSNYMHRSERSMRRSRARLGTDSNGDVPFELPPFLDELLIPDNPVSFRRALKGIDST